MPNIRSGGTTISILGYFAHPDFPRNPLNTTTLGLLPKFSYEKEYGDSLRTKVDDSALKKAMHMPHKDAVTAERKCETAIFLVAGALDLTHPLSRETYNDRNRYSLNRGVNNLAKTVNKDLDLGKNVVGELKEVVAFVQSRGYSDFLDYMVDTKNLINNRVDTIFDNAAQ